MSVAHKPKAVLETALRWLALLPTSLVLCVCVMVAGQSREPTLALIIDTVGFGFVFTLTSMLVRKGRALAILPQFFFLAYCGWCVSHSARRKDFWTYFLEQAPLRIPAVVLACLVLWWLGKHDEELRQYLPVVRAGLRKLSPLVRWIAVIPMAFVSHIFIGIIAFIAATGFVEQFSWRANSIEMTVLFGVPIVVATLTAPKWRWLVATAMAGYFVLRQYRDFYFDSVFEYVFYNWGMALASVAVIVGLVQITRTEQQS